MFTIKKGLDVPLSGAPKQQIESGPVVKTVAVIGPDYHGMKPTMLVGEGDVVSLGQKLFEDKKTPGVFYTAPAAGTVVAVNRGERRMLESVVIDIDAAGQELSWESFSAQELGSLDRNKVVEQLTESGQWAAFRTRPYSKTPSPDTQPEAIFVTAVDTNPLAVDPSLVVAEHSDDFQSGLKVMARLTQGKVYVCSGKDLNLGVSGDRVEQHKFTGPHPAGLPGTHIGKLHPVSIKRVVWTIGYQDVIAVGKLFTTGKLFVDRIVSLGGPQVKQPKVLRTRLGASLSDLTAGNLNEGENRVISGSVLSGRTAANAYAYLGRYDNQITVLAENIDRPILHYVQAGRNRFSALPIYVSRLMGKKKWDFNTATNGSERAMVPIGAYEQVMPLDILPTQLLRALIVGDTATAQELGALELDEEDLALCTFVCPGKYEYGEILRDNLSRIEREG